jgi:cystathionine beta-lyase/cystathionine gamma-synthase
METESQLARGQMPALDRATVHPYENAVPGPVYYQRMAHPVGLEAERVLGELEGGSSLLFSSGAGATTAVALALLAPGATMALAEGGYYGTVGEWSRARARRTSNGRRRFAPPRGSSPGPTRCG